jgi:type IV fimbrial biogenesis protein FimT
MTTQANEFLTSLHFTRSEAVKRNGRVTMCRSNTLTECTTAAGTWAQGWIIFVDGGAVGVFDGDDKILRVHAALTDGSTLVGGEGVPKFVSYSANGLSDQSGKFDLCSNDTSLAGRDIILSVGSGRPSLVVDDPPVTCN